MDPMEYSNAFFEKLLSLFRRWLSADFLNGNAAWLLSVARYTTPLAALLGLVLGIIGAIKTDSFLFFLMGLVWVFVISVSYFIGSRFLRSCNNLLVHNPSRISSAELLDMTSLVLIFGLIGVFVGGAYIAIQTSSLSVLNWIVPAAIALLYYICMLLNPSLISTEVAEAATAGEDALAIMIIAYKAAVKLAGIVFGSGPLIGSVMLISSLFKIFSNDGDGVLSGGLQSLGGAYAAVGGLLYPFFIYFLFVFVYLVLDLFKAVLTLHRRGLN